MKREINELFPSAYVTQSEPTQEVLQLLVHGQKVAIPLSDLTKREQWLIEHLAPKTKNVDEFYISTFSTGWEHFILNHSQQVPLLRSNHFIQWLFIQPHDQPIPNDEWLNILQTVIPHAFGAMWLNQDTILVATETADPFNLLHLLQEIEEPLSEELGQLFNGFVGHRWPIASYTSDLLVAELEIFQRLQTLNQPFLTHLPAISSWYFQNEWQQQQPLTKQLIELFQATRDEQELITAMWETSLNISKASQLLFIHRNTLNYRLDRFYAHTGFQLRQVDELTFVKSFYPQFHSQSFLS